MKKFLPVFLVVAFILAGCGAKDLEETQTTDTMSSEVATDTASQTWVQQWATWVPAWEQINLAPSDTPRAIAEWWVYLPYTPTALAQAGGDIVLFFYASWSPVSIATNKDIIEKKDKIPQNLTILRVSFDDADEMKQQYWITEQQTFVQVTNTGELIKKWRGANTLEDIVQQIKK